MKYPIIFNNNTLSLFGGKKKSGLEIINVPLNDNLTDSSIKKSEEKVSDSSSSSGLEVINNPLSDKEIISDPIYDSEFNKHCKGYKKLPHILPEVKRIIAIGDLHGDLDLTKKCLKLAEVVDDKMNWIADKSTVVIQIGDQVDRCRPTIGKKCIEKDTTPNDKSEDIKILELFYNLHKKAIRKDKNSGVYSLLGNHEIMNVQGNLSYVSHAGLEEMKNKVNPDTKKKFKSGREARKYFFSRGRKYAKFLACTRQTAMIVGSNLFVHATIVPKLAKIYNVKDINILVRKWLLNIIDSDEKVDGIGNLGDILTNYNLSPFWPRLLGNLPENIPFSDERCIDYLKETLELYNCNNMIIGHTPQPFAKSKSGINATCRGINDNKEEIGVWRVDNAGSSGFDNFENINSEENRKPSVLEIIIQNGVSNFNVLKLED